MHIGDLNSIDTGPRWPARLKFLGWAAMVASIGLFFLALAYGCLQQGYTTPAAIFAAIPIIAAFILGIGAGG